MRILSFTCGLIGGVLLLCSASPAYACGGGLVAEVSADVGANTQRILLSVRGSATDVVTQVGVPETTSDYGVLLPVPVEPTLDPEPVDSDELDVLFAATAPRITTGSADDDDGGCGCPIAGSSKASSGGGSGRGVDVGDPVDIGPVTAVVLGGDDGDAITAWLADNDFALPEEGEALVGEYSGGGRYFIAIRRNDSAASGGATSIGVHFTLPGDQRGLPLRFAKLGAAETVAFTVLVAADDVAAPVLPFEALTLDDLSADALRLEGYSVALEQAIGERGGRAFVIESTHAASDLMGFTESRVTTFFDADQTVTRLTAVLSAATLTDDVSLDDTYGGDVPSERHVRNGFARANGFAYGSVFALAATALGRRARRRGQRA